MGKYDDMDEEGYIWRTVGGRRIRIKVGQTLSDAMKESGKFKKVIKGIRKNNNTQEDNEYAKRSFTILSSDEYYELRNQKLKKLSEIGKRYDYEKEQLKEKYRQGKLTDEQYDKDSIGAWEKANKEGAKYQFQYIADSKKDNFIIIDKDNVFTSENKKFDTSKQSIGFDKLTDEEKNALMDYTSQYGYGSYSNINDYLNTGFVPSFSNEDKIKGAIQTIDKAMQKSRLGQDCQVYRGIEPSKLNNPEIVKAIDKFNHAIKKGSMTGMAKNLEELKSLKGKSIETKGYMSTSTSLDPNYAKRGVTLVINAKKSDKAIYIQPVSKYGGRQDTYLSAFSKGAIQHESEILFDKNTKLKIKDVAITTSGVQLLCDVE